MHIQINIIGLIHLREGFQTGSTMQKSNYMLYTINAPNIEEKPKNEVVRQVTWQWNKVKSELAYLMSDMAELSS